MRVLVTGLSGFLGHAIARERPPETVLMGWSRTARNCSTVSGVESWLVSDLSDATTCRNHLSVARPDVVIHAAGEPNVDQVQREPEQGISSNILPTLVLAEACRELGIRLIYISTNAVFGGDAAPYAEDDAIAPVNYYGMIKGVGEAITRFSDPSNVVVRPILMYGWNTPGGRDNPVTFTLRQLRLGNSVSMVTDVRENPLFVNEAARAIWTIVQQRATGTFNLAGADTLNRFELAVATAEAFGLDPRLIIPVDSSAFPSIAPRPHDTSFLTERMVRELGISPVSLRSGLERMRAMEPA